MKFTLLIGRKSKSFFGPDKSLKYDGNYDRTNLKLDSMDTAHAVAKLAKADCYKIMKLNGEGDYWSYDPPVYETPDITAYDNAKTKEAEDFDTSSYARAEAINALPDRVPVENLNVPGLKVYLEKSEYHYNKAYSRRLQGHFNFVIEKGEGENARVKTMFYPKEYISRDKKVLLSKFKKDFSWNFMTDTLLEMPEAFDYRDMLMKLVEAHKLMSLAIRNAK